MAGIMDRAAASAESITQGGPEATVKPSDAGVLHVLWELCAQCRMAQAQVVPPHHSSGYPNAYFCGAYRAESLSLASNTVQPGAV